MKTFMELCKQGRAKLDEIDDYIDKWHENVSASCPLHTYLGMSWEQYQLWVQNPSNLDDILNTHKYTVTLRITANAVKMDFDTFQGSSTEFNRSGWCLYLPPIDDSPQDPQLNSVNVFYTRRFWLSDEEFERLNKGELL